MKNLKKYLEGIADPHKAKIFKTFEILETKVADGQPRTLVVKISTVNADRSRDTVQPSGMQADNFLKNPVVLFAHKYDTKPIAKCTSLKVMDDCILATVEFLPEGVYQEADIIYTMYKEGFLSAWSIGFMPTDYDENMQGGYNFKQWELFEFSSVPVPDNPEALTIMRSKGIDVDKVLEKKEQDEDVLSVKINIADAEEVKETIENATKAIGALTLENEKLKKAAEQKDVSQIVALGYLLDELSYFIKAFTQMGVKQESIEKLQQALALVMNVVQEQAIVGEKSIKLPATMKAGRTISSKHEEMLKTACEHMNAGAEQVKTVLDSVSKDDEESDEGKTVPNSYVTRLASSLKQTDKTVGLTLRLLKTIESERRGLK